MKIHLSMIKRINELSALFSENRFQEELAKLDVSLVKIESGQQVLVLTEDIPQLQSGVMPR